MVREDARLSVGLRVRQIRECLRMSPIKRVGFLVGAASLTLTGGSFADTDAQTNQELKSRITELESRLAAVESTNSEDWLTEQRAEEIKGLVQDVLADADTRSSMLAQGANAGYDDGFVISSSDGNWLLRTNFVLQTRWAWNHASTPTGTPPPAGTNNSAWGFEVPRAKFILSGNVVSPQWFYLIDINVGTNLGGLGATSPFNSGAVFSGVPPTDVRTGVLNAYAGYDYENGWKVRVGQFKDTFLREEIVDTRYQLAVERSNVNYLFTTGYTQGIAVDYETDQWRATANINDGARTGVTAALAATTAFAVTGRFEYLVMGTWDQFTDFTSPAGDEMGVLVGAAMHYQKYQAGIAGSPNSWIGLTADAQMEFGGANAFVSGTWQNVNQAAGSGIASNSQFGLVGQGGYYFTDMWEGFARYEVATLQQATVPTMQIVSFGVNAYLSGHNAKWTTDFGISLSGLKANPGSGAGAGDNVASITNYRTDSAGHTGQFVIRSQLQIAF